MITKTGVVKVTALKIQAADFNFDGDLTDAGYTNEVIDWAIARLESERIPDQTTQEPK